MDEHTPSLVSRTPTAASLPLDAFSSLAKDSNRCDWERRLRSTLRQLGFARYLISLGPPRPGGNDPLAGVITSFPRCWLEHYCGDNLIEIDPILKHCRRELLPIFWERERRRARGRSQHFWQQREGYGLRNGMSIPLRYELLRGSLSVAFDDSMDDLQGSTNPAVCQLFMLVPYLLAGLRYRLDSGRRACADLTPKESECLYWASAGKTTWEISHILACSPRTIDFHLLNARRKLGSISRQQAVGAATAGGLGAVSYGAVG